MSRDALSRRLLRGWFQFGIGSILDLGAVRFSRSKLGGFAADREALARDARRLGLRAMGEPKKPE